MCHYFRGALHALIVARLNNKGETIERPYIADHAGLPMAVELKRHIDQKYKSPVGDKKGSDVGVETDVETFG